MGYQLVFDKEKCVGCLTCHTACISTHHPDKISGTSFRAVQKLVNEEEGFQKLICPGCTHCGACLKTCPKQAIERDDKSGFILVSREKCTGCKSCEVSCPIGVIRFDTEGRMEKCDGCIGLIDAGKEPACVRNCPTGAIALEEG